MGYASFENLTGCCVFSMYELERIYTYIHMNVHTYTYGSVNAFGCIRTDMYDRNAF